jgi:hypothetical protein
LEWREQTDSFDEVGLFISIISRPIDELAASPIKICPRNVLGMRGDRQICILKQLTKFPSK